MISSESNQIFHSMKVFWMVSRLIFSLSLSLSLSIYIYIYIYIFIHIFKIIYVYIWIAFLLWPRKGSLMKTQTRILDNRLYYTRNIVLHRKGKKSRTVRITPILICLSGSVISVLITVRRVHYSKMGKVPTIISSWIHISLNKIDILCLHVCHFKSQHWFDDIRREFVNETAIIICISLIPVQWHNI